VLFFFIFIREGDNIKKKLGGRIFLCWGVGGVGQKGGGGGEKSTSINIPVRPEQHQHIKDIPHEV